MSRGANDIEGMINSIKEKVGNKELIVSDQNKVKRMIKLTGNFPKTKQRQEEKIKEKTQ